ncbi:MAG: hypothetical protein Q9173_005555 [Seirophora scorigena]
MSTFRPSHLPVSSNRTKPPEPGSYSSSSNSPITSTLPSHAPPSKPSTTATKPCAHAMLYLDLDCTIRCVIARNPVAWQQATDHEAYTTSDRAKKVTQGQPAVRYALVREPQNTYIVWTAMHSAMDGLTRKLLCDELADFLRDPTKFRTRPAAPPSSSSVNTCTSSTPPPEPPSGPPTAPASNPPAPSRRRLLQDHPRPRPRPGIVREFSFQRPSSTAIRLSSMGQTAFALTLSFLTDKSKELFFYTLRASRTMLPGPEAIMGCLFHSIPTRTTLRPEESVTALLARVQDESTAVMRHEPFEMMVSWGLPGGIRAADVFTFNWVPRATDLFPRDDMRAPRGGGGGGGGALKVVRERFSSSTLKGLFYVYDNGGSLRLKVLWDDRVFSAALVEKIMGRFVEMLDWVAGCGEVTVGELLDRVSCASDRS